MLPLLCHRFPDTLLRILLVLLCSLYGTSAEVLAQSSSTRSTLTHTYSGLRRAVSIEPVSTDTTPVVRYRLRHPEAMLDHGQPLDILVHRVDVPTGSRVQVTVDVHTWYAVPHVRLLNVVDSTVRMFKIGRHQERDVWAIHFNPWVLTTINSMSALSIADSVTLTISIERGESLTSGHAMMVPIDATSWIDPQALYVALHTINDGIALVRGTTILATEPGFAGVEVDSLALIHRGTQEYLAIEDDGDGVVSADDRFYFQARRPAGDTMWYDVENSQATFFLASRWSENRRRYAVAAAPDPGSAPPLTSLRIQRHIEFDTGYYHLGNALLEDFADYYTPLANLEGFYWENLNAKAFHRATHRFRCTPAPDAVMDVTMHYISGTDVRSYKPDSRADLSINGGAPFQRTTDGAGAFFLSASVQGAHLPAALQSVKLFATGIDSLRSRPDYRSQIVLDYYNVTTTILPVLDSGRLSGEVRDVQPGWLSIWNARTASVVAIDTINHTWHTNTTLNEGAVLRAGMTPLDLNWSTDTPNNRGRRVSAIFGDHEVEIDSIDDLVLMLDAPTGGVRVFRWSTDQTALTSAISQAPRGTAFALFVPHASSVPDASTVILALLDSVPSGDSWCSVGLLGDTTVVWQGANGVGGTLLSSSTAVRGLATAYTGRIPVQPADGKGVSFLVVADASAIQQATVRPARLSSLLTSVEQTDMIIVTHNVHRTQAERLAAHRRKHSNASVSIYDIDHIMDEFSYGYTSPEALRSFLAQLYDRAPVPKPRYLLLVGNATWDPRLAIRRGNAGSRRAQQVPTYGRPSSDYYYGLLDDAADVAAPELIVGRIPALTEEESRNHVSKIIAMDTADIGSWIRRWLFVGGGVEQEGLCDIYQNLLDDPFQSGITFTDQPLCLDTTTVCGYREGSSSGYVIKQALDRGLQWMNYIGHGATDQFDIRGWEPSELLPSANFGVLATYACQTGAFSNPSVACKNADYLTTPNVGFAAAVGGTGWARIVTINYLHYRIHELLRGTSIRTLGDLIYEAKAPFADRGDQDGINTVMQFCILGDPMSRLRMGTTPEVYLRSSDVRVTSETGSSDLTDGDEYASVNVVVHSAGIGVSTPVTIMFTRTYADRIDTVVTSLPEGLCLQDVVQVIVPIRNQPGEHRITITVDPSGTLGDDPTDNTIMLVATVLPRAMLPLEPQPHETLSGYQPAVRILDPLSYADPTLNEPYTVRFAILRPRSLDVEPGGEAQMDTLLMSGLDEVRRDRSIVDWSVDLGTQPLAAGPAVVQVLASHPDTKQLTAALHIPVFITDSQPSVTVTATIATESFRGVPSTNIARDRESGDVVLASTRLPVYVRSRGVRTADIFEDRMIQMRIGNVLYVDNPFYRGVNVIVLDPTDSVPSKIRRYDTYWDPDLTPGWNNGTSRECIEFLRDSVLPHQQVLLAVAYESFSGFEADGTMQEFRTLMSTTYHSKFADSLRDQVSWILFSGPGRPVDEVRELWAPPRDSLVTLRDELVITAPEAIVTSPWIGPARTWGPWRSQHSDAGVHWSVVGRTQAGEERVLYQDSSNVVWLPNVEDADISDIQFRYFLTAGSDGQYARRASVTRVSGTFDPADEWLIEPQDVSVYADSVLQGDTATITVTVRNARSRQSTVPTTVSLATVSTTGDEPLWTAAVAELTEDELLNIGVPVSTSRFLGPTTFAVTINPEQAERRETYRFNNRRTTVLTTFKDTIQPTIGMLADGVDRTNGGVVPMRPHLDVLVRDQSSLDIADPSRLLVFVNGDRIRPAVADSVEFLSTTACRERYDDASIKAALRFIYPLEAGDNNVLVRASDASGNSVETTIVLRTTERTSLSGVRAVPHPFSNNVQLHVMVETSQAQVDATVDITDQQGRTVRSFSAPLSFGNATIYWDGTASDNISLPSGVYGYRLSVEGAADQRGLLVKLPD